MIDKEAKKNLDLQLANGEITPEEHELQLKKLAEAGIKEKSTVRADFEKISEKLPTGELEGADLTRVVWKKRDLSNARLAHANLSRAKLSKCNFANADLSAADLSGADLSGANLSNAKLSGANLKGAILKEAILDGADLSEAQADEISAVGSSWQKTKVRAANLKDADMARATINEADFSLTDLSEADLSDTKIAHVDFNKTKMIRTSLQNAQLEKVSFLGIEAGEINLNLAALSDADFSGASLPRADISNAFLERVNLADADLTAAVFNVSEHREVNLTGAKLADSSFRSMTGYSEEELKKLAEIGAKVDQFYLRRFGQFFLHSNLAKAAVFLILALIAGGIYFYLSNPENWSFEKLDRVAQEYRDQSKHVDAEKLYRIILKKFANNAARVAMTRNALGNLLLETKRYADAEGLFRSVIDAYPDQTSAVLAAELGLADILREQKKLDEAEKALLAITEKFADHPQSIDAWDRLATIAKLKGDDERAREIYEKIIGQRALDENAIVRAQFDLAQMLQENRDFEAAIAKYREIVERFGEGAAGPRALSIIIQLEVERGRLAEAEKVLEELRSNYRDQLDSINDGELYFANALLGMHSREQEGLKRLQKLLDDNPGSVTALWAGKNIADYYARNEQYDKADALFQRLLKEYQDNQRNRLDLLAQVAALEIKRGNPDAAVTRLKQVLSEVSEPDQVRAILTIYADALAAKGDIEGARKAFRQLGERFPEDPDAQIAAIRGEAGLLKKVNRRDEAATLYRKIIGMTDQPAQIFAAYMDLVLMKRETGDFVGEEKILREMLKRFENDPLIQPQVQLSYAENQRLQENYDEALKTLRAIADLDIPSRPAEALNAMLTIYAEQGKMDQVAKIREEIRRRFPDDTRAQFNAQLETASMLWRQGDWQRAVEEYKSVAEKGETSFRMQALSALLQLYAEKRMEAEAEAIYKTILSEFIDSRDVIDNANLVWAGLLRFTGRGDQAVKLYETLVKNNTGKQAALWALDGLAQFYLEGADYANAEKTYRRMLAEPAIVKNPEEKLKAQNGLGAVAEAKRDYVNALAAYRTALSFAQTDGERLSVEQSLVRVLSDMGRIEEGQKVLAQMRQNYPNADTELDIAAFSVLGAMLKKNQVNEALAGYEKIYNESKIKENKAAALGYIAQAQISLNRLDAAEKTYRRMLANFSDDQEQRKSAEMGIALVLKQQRKYQQAIDILRRMVVTYANDPEIRYQALATIAKIHEETGRINAAREAYNKLKSEYADIPNAQATALLGLANLLSLEGKYEEAIRQYRSILNTDADSSIKITALNSVAQIYMQQGRFEQARSVYEELAKNFSQDADMAITARMGEADTLRQNGDYEGALALYQQISAQAPDAATKSRIRIAIARIYLDQKKSNEARNIFNAIQNDASVDIGIKVEAQAGLADLLRREGNLDGAADVYKKVHDNAEDINIKQFALNAIAQIRISQGRLADAEQIFREMNRSHGDNIMIRVDALMGLGDVLSKRGDYSQALSTYTEVRKISPDSQHALWALTAIAQTYLAQKKYDEAIRAYQEVLKNFDDNLNAKIDAQLGIANVLKEKHEDQKAIAAFKKIIEDYPDAGQVYWALSGMAQIYALNGDVQLAAQTYQEIEKRFPENAQGLADSQLNYANLMKNSGRREDAAKSYRQIVTDYPGTSQAAMALEGLAQLQVEESDFAGARQTFQTMLKNFANDPQVVLNANLGIGQVQLMEGQFDAAIVTFQNALKKAAAEPDKVRTLNMIGQAYMGAGRYAKAREIFEQIFKLYPKNEEAMADARMGLGSAYMAENNPKKAREYFQKVAEDFQGRPRASSALQSWASAEIALGDYNKTEEIINRLLKDHPDDPNAIINVRMNAANQLRSEGQLDQALTQVNQVVARYSKIPQAAWAQHFRAQVLTEQKKFDQAVEVYSRIIKDYESNQDAVIDAYYGLAEVDRMQQKFDEALAGYQKIVAQWPSYQQAIGALNAMAQIYSERRQVDKEEAVYNKIIKDFANNANAVLNARISLANLLLGAQRYDEALKQFTTVYQQYPKSEQAPWAKAGAARLLASIGQEKRAEQLFKEIIASYPADHEVVIGAKEFLKTLYERQ